MSKKNKRTENKISKKHAIVKALFPNFIYKKILKVYQKPKVKNIKRRKSLSMNIKDPVIKKKVIIEGVDGFAKTLKLRCDHVFDIAAFIMPIGATKETKFEDVPVYADSSALTELEYDFVFITTLDFCEKQREYNTLYNVPYEKMISMRYTHQPGKQTSFLAFANEIAMRKIEGSIVELGVDTGGTAKYLNLYYPDRTLYLFDTFSGFDKRDIEFERTKRPMTDSLANYYNMRSKVEDVLNKMFFKEKCVVKQGYFPESLDGLEDTFAFVHIDCDLEKPVLAALEYFYPRLNSGGIICVHDFHNPLFGGVRKVVRDFCIERNIAYSPNTAFEGAIICK